MEHFRRWGIADAVRHAGFPLDLPRNVSFVTRLAGYDLGRVDRPSNGQQQALSATITPEGPIWCPKFLFEEVMRKRLSESALVEELAGCEITRVVQDGDGVEIAGECFATGRRLSRRVRYLAACDGASSDTRKALGISFQGSFAEGRNLGIFFRSGEIGDIMREKRCVMADIINPEFSANLSAVDGKELWRLIIFARGSDPGTLDPMDCIQRAAGRSVAAEIIEARVWAGHTVVAERFQSGRIFLAGDAAHLLWPRGGFGMNTGIGDAVDLGWKLEAVLKGWAGAGLLASYEAERRPVAIRNVAEAAANYHSEATLPISPHVEEDSPHGREDRGVLARNILETRTREWATIGLQLGYTYEGSPVCLRDGTPAPPMTSDTYIATTRAGARAPHVWLRPGLSSLDEFGRGFCVVHDEGKDMGAFQVQAERLGIPLRIWAYPNDEQRQLYERAIVLVRPDGHVAWRGDEVPGDVAALLGQVVGRDVEHTSEFAATGASA